MAARALALSADVRCLAAGLLALAVGVLTFPVVAVLAVATPQVSGTWLVLPCSVAAVGVAAVLAWLVFGDGAVRSSSASVSAQPWGWHPTEH